ncbi:MAG: hypothetical protein QXS18_05605 [Thermoplasmata archaeon]
MSNIIYSDLELQSWEIKKILSEQLNNKLKEMENFYKEKNLYIPLEPIKKFYFGDPPEPPLQNLPAISIYGGTTRIEDRAMHGWTMDVNLIYIKCYIIENLNSELEGHLFYEILYLKSLRYAKTIRQILMDVNNRNLNNNVEYIRIPAIIYSDTISLENVALKWCRLEVETIGKRRSERI